MEPAGETMKALIYERLRPKMESLFWRTAQGGSDFVMEGVSVYNERAQFVGGKVINMSCYVVLEFLRGTPDWQKGLETLKSVISMVSELPMETWGILNGITGLYRLKTAGLLEEAVEKETMESLKKSLDWRTFVDIDDHYRLIGKPTNYYGVAFGIAKYRELMGWENEGHSRVLLDRLMEHIHQYSGELGYMDETAGDGRFDRYSILIPGEMISLIMATGMEAPKKLRSMLRSSAEIFLHLAGEKGLGFAYGRSIGAYGDTAALEVLSAAAEAGAVYTGDEAEIAYGYSVRLMETMMDFWYDPDMQSVNMWEKGRRTDGYRNKNRILGENMSLFMQMVNTYEHWARAGWEEREVSPELGRMLEGIEKHCFVRFAKGEYERGLAIVRDRGHVWSLPLIGGGKKYYATDPYLPIPQENLVLDQVPDLNHGNLVPELVMKDGRVLRPICYMKEIRTEERDGTFTVTYSQDEMCLMGGERPETGAGVKSVTRYIFEPGRIRRKDEFFVAPEASVEKIRLTQLVYSSRAKVLEEEKRVIFGHGEVKSLTASGYDACRVEKTGENGDFDTPRGRLETKVTWETRESCHGEKLAVEWSLEYV